MSLHHPDHQAYIRFAGPLMIDKAVHALKGILCGISIDEHLNAAEISEVLNWLNEHARLRHRAPFSELIPALERVLADGIIDPEEQQDLIWLCKNLSSEEGYFNEVTHTIQSLHGIMQGILADGVVSDEEIRALSDWVDEHAFLKGSYPYDELDSLLLSVLKDGKIDESERTMLEVFFSDFASFSRTKRISDEASRIENGRIKQARLSGVCSNCPEVSFTEKGFTFTGASVKAKRADLMGHVTLRGGTVRPGVSQKTDFLIIGADGNPCWAFACYGRKVEQAVELRRQGHAIVLVHEADFWDALEDYPAAPPA
jgi:NAD-dependent DNA ligase